MATKNHIHKYHRRKFGATGFVWACAFSDCTHYIPKHSASLAEGRQSICNQCGGEFVLTAESLLDEKPRCEDCKFDAIKHEDIVPVTSVLTDFLKGH